MGRYILTPGIFTFLDQQGKGVGGEIQFTDAIENLNQIQLVFAYYFERRNDVGEKSGFVKITIEFAIQDPVLGEDLLVFMAENVYLEKNEEVWVFTIILLCITIRF